EPACESTDSTSASALSRPGRKRSQPTRQPGSSRGSSSPEPLADAEGQCGELWPAEEGRPGRPAGRIDVVGHAHNVDDRVRGYGEREGTGAEGQNAWPGGGDVELPFFPPGPGERKRWAAILAGHPDLAPALECEVRGMADGFPRRLD